MEMDLVIKGTQVDLETKALEEQVGEDLETKDLVE